jgi:hypothetical protein
MADCYYSIGEYTKAIQMAKKACSLASASARLSVCEMAQYWIEDYELMLKDPRAKKSPHLYY